MESVDFKAFQTILISERFICKMATYCHSCRTL